MQKLIATDGGLKGKEMVWIVFLFNSISTFVGYLMSKLVEEQ